MEIGKEGSLVLFLCIFAPHSSMRFLHPIHLLRSFALLVFVWFWTGSMEVVQALDSGKAYYVAATASGAPTSSQLLASPSETSFSWSFFLTEEENEEESEQDDHDMRSFGHLQSGEPFSGFPSSEHQFELNICVQNPIARKAIALFVWHHSWRSFIG